MLVNSAFRGYNYALSTGDVNRDGRSDILGRDRNGTLWFFPGTGNIRNPFGKRASLGSAVKNFKILF